MLNCTGKYVTVFNPRIMPEISEKILFANLSTSKKITHGEEIEFENMSWSGRFVGTAFEKAASLKNKDKIDIVKGSITNRYDKEKEKLYVDVTVFDFNLSDLSKGSSKPSEQVDGKQ